MNKFFSQKNGSLGAVPWWIIVVVVIVVVIIAGVIVESGSNSGNEENGGNGNNDLCPSYCLAFVELECGSNKLVGGCFGLWDCDDGVVNQCE